MFIHLKLCSMITTISKTERDLRQLYILHSPRSFHKPEKEGHEVVRPLTQYACAISYCVPRSQTVKRCLDHGTRLGTCLYVILWRHLQYDYKLIWPWIIERFHVTSQSRENRTGGHFGVQLNADLVCCTMRLQNAVQTW